MDEQADKKRFRISVFVGFLIMCVVWIIFILDNYVFFDLSFLALRPRSIGGLIGIFFSPFLHGFLRHIMSNSLPLWALVTSLLYFFPKNGYRLLLIFWLLPEFLLWIIGRDARHIGVSTQIYAIASFILFYGILSKNSTYLILSLLIIFLYGSMFWGIFPFSVLRNVSWEGHLSGFIVGVVCAFVVNKPKELSSTSNNIEFVYNYDFCCSNSTWNLNFFYNFETKKVDEKYDYQNNYCTNSTNFYIIDNNASTS